MRVDKSANTSGDSFLRFRCDGAFYDLPIKKWCCISTLETCSEVHYYEYRLGGPLACHLITRSCSLCNPSVLRIARTTSLYIHIHYLYLGCHTYVYDMLSGQSIGIRCVCRDYSVWGSRGASVTAFTKVDKSRFKLCIPINYLYL